MCDIYSAPTSSNSCPTKSAPCSIVPPNASYHGTCGCVVLNPKRCLHDSDWCKPSQASHTTEQCLRMTSTLQWAGYLLCHPNQLRQFHHVRWPSDAGLLQQWLHHFWIDTVHWLTDFSFFLRLKNFINGQWYAKDAIAILQHFHGIPEFFLSSWQLWWLR